VFHDDTLYHAAGVPVVIEDAIGAGDAFSAAYMTEFVRTGDPQAAARLANRVGAFVASHRGPIPTYTDDVLRAVRGCCIPSFPIFDFTMPAILPPTWRRITC